MLRFDLFALRFTLRFIIFLNLLFLEIFTENFLKWKNRFRFELKH